MSNRPNDIILDSIYQILLRIEEQLKKLTEHIQKKEDKKKNKKLLNG